MHVERQKSVFWVLHYESELTIIKSVLSGHLSVFQIINIITELFLNFISVLLVVSVVYVTEYFMPN